MLKIYLGELIREDKICYSFLTIEDNKIDFICDGPGPIHITNDIILFNQYNLRAGTIILNGKICTVKNVSIEEMDLIKEITTNLNYIKKECGTSTMKYREILGNDNFAVPLIMASSYLVNFLEKYDEYNKKQETVLRKLMNFFKYIS